MNKKQLKMNHFYRTLRGDFYIYVFVWFQPNKGGWEWVGKYGKNDSAGYVNDLYYSGIQAYDNYEYEEVSMSDKVFSNIGRFVIKEIFSRE